MSEEDKSEVSTNCRQLKLKARDGKMRLTDVADIQGIFRIIQSVPSPKAEPFKIWLAEATTKELVEEENPTNLEENKQIARAGGSVAGNARREIEARTGKPVTTKKKAIDFTKFLVEIDTSKNRSEKISSWKILLKNLIKEDEKNNPFVISRNLKIQIKVY